jgi:hypothetical protein
VPLYVIWAYGAAGDQIQYHGSEHRGSKLLVLAPPAAAAAGPAPAAAKPAAAKPAAAGGERRLLQGGGGVHGAAPGVDAAKAARASAEAVKVGDRVVNLTLPRLVVSTNETTYMVGLVGGGGGARVQAGPGLAPRCGLATLLLAPLAWRTPTSMGAVVRF